MTVQSALDELERYAKLNVRHSLHQYDKHGTLHSVAQQALRDDSDAVFAKPWVPWDFDIGNPYDHPVYQQFTEQQKLAWNHLEWAYNYEVVAAGERQIIVLNKYAVRQYRHILPSVVELEERESFEEVDHVAAFQTGLQAIYNRYLPGMNQHRNTTSPSGFRHQQANRLLRHLTGMAADKLLGKRFPTLFFLIRTIKTVSFKGMENSIAQFDQAPELIQRLSHLHRLDESRHQATALKLSKLSDAVLEKTGWESERLFKLAIHTAWPKNRMLESRLQHWRQILFGDTSRQNIFSSISLEDKQAFFTHISMNAQRNLLALHPRQVQITQQVTKRAVEEAGLSREFKQLFVEVLGADPIHRNLVEAVRL